MKQIAAILLIALFAALTSCKAPSTDTPAWQFPPAPRIVALGDLHGDLDASRRALRLAGAIDENDHWIGGELVLVQTGDQIDRGDNDQAIIDLFDRLATEAAAAGGAVHQLNANHELMNVALDLRYPSPAGFEDFEDAVEIGEIDSLLASFDEEQHARVTAFRPGGPYARLLSKRNTVLTVGDNVFVHGGVLPEHLDYGLGRLNTEIKAWIAGEGEYEDWMLHKRSPVWDRHYSLEVDAADCDTLHAVLARMGAKRMIVGHTVQEEGIRSNCDGAVWCIDTGMSSYYGGKVQVLEITGDSIRILSE